VTKTAAASPAEETYKKLVERYREVEDLGAASALMHWDQETQMPSGAGAMRARQLQTLSGFIHRHFTDLEVGRMLDAAGNGASPDLTPLQNKAVAEFRRDYDRSTKMPESLVKELAEAESIGVEAWKEARKKKDFPLFAPALRRLFDLNRRKAEAIGKGGDFACLYDVLHDPYERGMTKSRLTPLFAGLRDRTVKLLKSLKGSKNPPTDALIQRHYPEKIQWDVSLHVLKAIGYDFNHGRQDKSAHPFSGGTGPYDVRVTTRLMENWFNSCFYSALHEGGHALYEQGIDPAKVGDILAAATSLGMHESQSRLWENIVGRGRPFWRWMWPILQYAFSETLSDATEEEFFRAVNVVKPSFIRVEADEVTYNMHVILRYELESAMIEGEFDVAELPKRWNEKMDAYLGIVPPDDSQGCMQDVHWSSGLIGYFPTYTLGNIYSVPIFQAAEKAIGPQAPNFERGNFAPLRKWLRENIHETGRSETAEEIVRRVAGKPLDPGPYMDYLEKKCSAVYGL
jgi:carboxypeptidase Taq